MKENPWTNLVTRERVTYIRQFHVFAASLLLKGVSMRKIYLMCGMDPEVLGTVRIGKMASNIRTKIRKEHLMQLPAEERPVRERLTLENKELRKQLEEMHRDFERERCVADYLREENLLLKKSWPQVRSG